MIDLITTISPDRLARVTGLGYLVIILAGITAEFVVRSGLIVPGDAAATAENIMGSQSLFRLGIALDIVMLLFDVLLALTLYLLLVSVHPVYALMATFFRLVHAAVVGAGLLNLVFVLLLFSGSGYLAAWTPDQLNALAMVFLEAHGYAYVLGLIFFGIHCLVLGYLVFRSGFFPKVLGILLMVAASGYIVDGFANILLTNYSDYESIFMIVVFVPAFIGELSFTLWLLVKGIRKEGS
ncbi:MAG: DUF4386 domain-containing protein [Bacteroidia bacterium]|nr:MAG: DUF4386 domain-containing protein [Bacteroidia bacterium]